MTTTKTGTHAAELEYEFSAGQNALFRQLASTMRFCGAAMIAFGALLFIAGVDIAFIDVDRFANKGIQSPRDLFSSPIALLFFIPSLVVFTKGVYSYRASAHFRLITRTTGNDMKYLTIAVQELTRAYVAQRWIWLVCGILLVISLVT